MQTRRQAEVTENQLIILKANEPNSIRKIQRENTATDKLRGLEAGLEENYTIHLHNKVKGHRGSIRDKNTNTQITGDQGKQKTNTRPQNHNNSSRNSRNHVCGIESQAFYNQSRQCTYCVWCCRLELQFYLPVASAQHFQCSYQFLYASHSCNVSCACLNCTL